MHLDIPKKIEDVLQREFGDKLEPAAREALGVEAYRTGKLSLGEFAEMLGITTGEADGLLRDRGVYLDMTVSEVEEDVASLRELLRQ